MNDETYIQLTLEIAKRGSGFVSPNPMVGCVITKNNKIIGAGYHQKYGENHAEVNAINSAVEPLEGSTLYVNLEPCSHYGHTPPCVDKIIESKIKRVVIGTLDVNPIVSGNGVKKLKKAGIEVKVGVLEKECTELNKFFFKYITKKIPYVTLKIAQTLDGKIADESNYSQWITSSEARKLVHSLRSEYDAVLIGRRTAEIDNPLLTVRLTEGRNPWRVVLDSNLKLNTDLKLFTQNTDGKTILFTSKESFTKKNKIKKLSGLGVRIIFVKRNGNGNLNLKSILKELAILEITSLLVEGGSEIFSSFLRQNLFDDILLFISPKLLGSGVSTFNSIRVNDLKKAYKFRTKNSEIVGDDILLELTK
ncbi:MAG: bifunctional diaminohydroxyphosphoribosylaminopyrimidine deaminase/5-amino-6-(5-phosphoribosylamino)uracil reductase RibD [Ignavibacterium sp.]|uniref:bifunctional diaminohydroxyphosphoribosylaminopyrimidine deaminase/5-amino-6-(5-phosphoribosylamino)uracil reductase RibD n=1 Tax=Ignavibacterium sp. TaxID=2651167 RepID=UPI00329972C6